MINLLPQNEKKNIDREYHLRRIALVLMAAIALVGIAIVLMVPMYLTSFYKSRSIDATTASAIAKDKSDEQNYKQQIDQAKLLLKVLKPQASGMLPSNIVSLLVVNKTNDIKVNSISYSQNSPSGATVIVRGAAKTREALSAFTSALGRDKAITKVDIPVSNFAKDTNIPYVFTITTQ
jgi:Tfp pilus assembly protein PilN